MKQVIAFFTKLINWLAVRLHIAKPAVAPATMKAKASKTVYKDSATKKVVDLKKSRAKRTPAKPKK